VSVIAEARLFCDRLRFHLAGLDPLDVQLLALHHAGWRTDMLFELASDFSDALLLFERGEVSASTVREEAVAVAVEAFKVWIATTGLGRDRDGR
jgi:hypothetical protein